MLLEKDAHPRFHIGESLLPMNLPILERLGVLEQVRAIGMFKPGAEFPSCRTTPTALQHLPLRARDRPEVRLRLPGQARGVRPAAVRARAGQRRRRARRGQGRAHRVRRRRPPGRSVHARDADGNALRVRARYLVDASGRDTLFGSQLKLKQQEHAAPVGGDLQPLHRRRSAATGEDAGNITVQRFDARLDVADPAARRRDEHRRGVLPRIPEDSAAATTKPS